MEEVIMNKNNKEKLNQSAHPLVQDWWNEIKQDIGLSRKVLDIECNSSKEASFTLSWKGEKGKEIKTPFRVLNNECEFHYINGNGHYEKGIKRLVQSIFEHCDV